MQPLSKGDETMPARVILGHPIDGVNAARLTVEQSGNSPKAFCYHQKYV